MREVLVASPEVLRSVTGYRVHRGALASFERRPLPTPAELVADARFVVVLVDLVDHTNVGAIFRNAAALGADAVLVTPGCADPLYRRSVKVSMGAVLSLPWTRTGADPLADLADFQCIALTLAGDAADLRDDAGSARAGGVLLGTEGDGLPPSLSARADLRVRIPMAGGVDSLNVAAASAIALFTLNRLFDAALSGDGPPADSGAIMAATDTPGRRTWRHHAAGPGPRCCSRSVPSGCSSQASSGG